MLLTIDQLEWSGADGNRETLPLNILPILGEKGIIPQVPKVKPGFTGIIYDSMGRRQRYVQGEHVPLGEGEAVANKPEQSQQEETSHEKQETTTSGGNGKRPELGNADGGGTSGVDGGRQEKAILTARAQYTKPADTSVVPERLRQFLKPHGLEGAAKAISAMTNYGGFLLSSGTGTGKSRQELTVAAKFAEEGKKVLILSKKAVFTPNFVTGEFGGSFKADSDTMGIEVSVNDGTRAPEAGKIHLSTYDKINSLAQFIDKDTILILDEAHSAKNVQKSNRAKVLIDMADNAAAVMYATATPIDKPAQIAYLFRANIFGPYQQAYVYEKLGLTTRNITTPEGKKIRQWGIDPQVGAKEVWRRVHGLFNQLTAEGLMVQHEISMEGLNVNFEKITLPPEVHAKLQQIESGVSQNGLALLQQRLQQEPYKVPHAVELAKKELAAGKNVVIFAARVNEAETIDEHGKSVAKSEGTIKLLQEALGKEGIEPILLHGKLSKNKSKQAQLQREAVKQFQSGKGKVIIATIESGGTGINMDDTVGDAPRSLIAMTAPFSAMENMQMAGRIWRLNTKGEADIHYLFSDTKVDKINAAILNNKMKTLGAATGGQVEKLNITQAAKGNEELEEEAAKHEEIEKPYEWPTLIRSPVKVPQVKELEEFETKALSAYNETSGGALVPPPKWMGPKPGQSIVFNSGGLDILKKLRKKYKLIGPFAEPKHKAFRQITDKRGAKRCYQDGVPVKCNPQEEFNKNPMEKAPNSGMARLLAAIKKEGTKKPEEPKPLQIEENFKPDPSFVEKSLEYIKGLKPTEIESIKVFTGGANYKMNKAVRNCPRTLDCLGEYESLSRALLNVIDKAGKLPENTTLYRGMSVSNETKAQLLATAATKLKSSEPWSLPGFNSMSLDVNQAVDFAGEFNIQEDSANPILFRIKAKTGAYIAPLSYYPEQHEVVGSPKANYKIVKIGTDSQTKISLIDLEEV